MRPHKYRTWDKENNKYIYFDFSNIYGYEGELCGVILPDGETLLSDDLDIEDCTGRKNKAGKYIFDGDKIKSLNGIIYTVKWSNDDAMFYAKHGMIEYKAKFWHESETIGHIHEAENE